MTAGAVTRSAVTRSAVTAAAAPVAPPAGRAARRLGAADVGGLVGALGLLCVGVVLVAGPVPALLLLGTVVAGVLAVAAVLRPAVALVLLVAGEFGDVGQVLAENGAPGLYKGAFALGWVSVLVALRAPHLRARLRPLPLLALGLVGCYLLTELPGVLSTVSSQATTAFVSDQLEDLLFFFLVLLLARLVERPWSLAVMIVAPLAVIALLTVVNQVALGGTGTFGGFATVSTASGELITTPRYAGPLEDSNFWGRYLVLGLPFALALSHRAAAAGRRVARVGWPACALLIVAGMYLTQSRGTLIAGSAATLLWVVAAGPGVRRRALQLAPVAVLVLLAPGVGNRLINLGEAFEDAPSYAIDPSLVERTAALKIALIMFTEHPLWGIGPGAFGSAVPAYASRSTDLLIGSTRAPHNLYFELAAQTGVVGLAGWLVMVGGIVTLAVRTVVRLAGRDASGPGGAPTRALAAACFASVVGWSIASIFLHLSYFRPLLAVFALVFALDALTRRADPGPDAAAAARGLRRGVLRGAVVACVGAAVLATVQLGFGVDRYTARVVYTLKPAPLTYESYSIDVRSRVSVLPAFAAAAQGAARPAGVRVDAEPTNGVITATAVEGTAATATGALNRATARIDDALLALGLNRGFTLVAMAPPEVTVQRVYPPQVVGAGVAVAVGLGIAFVLGAERWRRRRRSREDPT